MRFFTLVMFLFTIVPFASTRADDADFFKHPPHWIPGETWYFEGFLPDSPNEKFYVLNWKVLTPTTLMSYEELGGHDQINYYTEQLEWIGVQGAQYNMLNGGQKEYSWSSYFSPTIPIYSWPLTLGKEWERVSTNTIAPGGTRTSSFKVVRMENLSTKFGVLPTAVIEQRLDGKLLSRRWYSPKMKNVVKEEQFVTYQNERLRLTLYLKEAHLK